MLDRFTLVLLGNDVFNAKTILIVSFLSCESLFMISHGD